MKNSDKPGTINHAGIVQSTDDKAVTVIISAESACSGCHAEGSCSLTGKEEKVVEVSGRYNVKPGDHVTVMMQQSMGFIAVLLSYIIPLILVVLVLIVLTLMKKTEQVAGLVSISALLPYYIILYLFKKRINNKFTFKLKI